MGKSTPFRNYISISCSFITSVLVPYIRELYIICKRRRSVYNYVYSQARNFSFFFTLFLRTLMASPHVENLMGVEFVAIPIVHSFGFSLYANVFIYIFKLKTSECQCINREIFNAMQVSAHNIKLFLFPRRNFNLFRIDLLSLFFDLFLSLSLFGPKVNLDDLFYFYASSISSSSSFSSRE